MGILEKLVQLETDAEAFGFQWETAEQIMAQIRSECDEINEQLQQGLAQANQEALQEEIGDLLHAAFSLCVFCKLNPKSTLDNTVKKFERRLNGVKKIAAEHGLTTLDGHSFEEMMAIWEKAKQLAG